MLDERDRRIAGNAHLGEQRRHIVTVGVALRLDGRRRVGRDHAEAAFDPGERSLEVEHRLYTRPIVEQRRHRRRPESRVVQRTHHQASKKTVSSSPCRTMRMW